MCRGHRLSAAWLMVVSAWVFGLAGCSQKQPGTNVAPQGALAPAGSVPEDEPGEPPSQAECEAFARSVEKSMGAAAWDAAFDWDALFRRAGGIEGAARWHPALQRFGKPEVIDLMMPGGSYRLLRIHDQGNRRLALFRVLLPKGRVNYHDAVLVRRPDGNVAIADVYFFLPGEMASQTVRRALLESEQSQGRTVRLRAGEGDLAKSARLISKMSSSVREGRPKEALEIYARLPLSVQQDKTVMLMRIMAAQQVDDQELPAAIEAFGSRYPDDPSLGVVALDVHLVKRQYAAALKGIDRLETAIGGDPYLDALRARVYEETKDYARSRAAAEKALAADPTLDDARWSLVRASLGEKQFGETTRLLRQLEENRRCIMGDLTRIPAYAEYVRSPEYREWLRSRPPRDAKAKPPAEKQPGGKAPASVKP